MKTSTANVSVGSQEPTSRYANILLDYWFKRSFGTMVNKRLMILVLREIIPHVDIQDITYTNKEHQSPFPEDHGVVFDIECRAPDGSRFVVEIQLAEQRYLMERALFYSTFSVQEQLAKGTKEYSFMPVYFIAMMNFSFHEDEPERFFYKYDILETTTGELMTDNLHFYFLELPKVKSINRRSTNLQKFCYAMHNMTTFESRPKEMKSELFELLFESADISKFTPEEKVKYEHDMTTERDRLNQLAFSHDKGREEGLKEGREEGREEGRAEERAIAEMEKKEIARSFLDQGVPAEIIAKSFGTSVEWVQALNERPLGINYR